MERSGVGSAVEAFARALGGAGAEAVEAYLDADTLVHMPGGSGLAGDYHGAEAISGLLDRMTAASEGTLRFEGVCTTAGSGSDVRLCGWLLGERDHRALCTTASVEAHVAGETIREAWLTCTDQPAWDRFWA